MSQMRCAEGCIDEGAHLDQGGMCVLVADGSVHQYETQYGLDVRTICASITSVSATSKKFGLSSRSLRQLCTR